jgi:WD40 repeat protein
LAVGTESKHVEIWVKDADKARWTRKHDVPAGAPVRSLCFSPAGNQLAVGMEHAGAGFFDPDTGKPLNRGVAIHNGLTVNAISTGRRDSTITWFLGGNRGIIPIDMGTTNLESKGDGNLPYEIRSVALSPDSRFLASGATLERLSIEDPQTGKDFPLVGHNGDVLAVALAPDCRTLVSASADGTVRLWDLLSKAQKAVLPDHSGDGTDVKR